MKVEDIREIIMKCPVCGMKIIISINQKQRIPKYCPGCEEQFPAHVREGVRLLRDLCDSKVELELKND